jgi:sulfite exporter TauE/SafE
MAGWAVANSPAVMVLRIIAALLLIAMGLYLAGWWSGLTRIEALGRGLWRYIQPFASRLMPVSSLPRALLLGALWGWLPCGLVYSTLLWAASQGNALDSGLLMLAFGLGTWPVLLATGMAAERLTAVLRKRNVRMAGGLLVILFGLWTLPGPHQQWLMGHAMHH